MHGESSGEQEQALQERALTLTRPQEELRLAVLPETMLLMLIMRLSTTTNSNAC